MRDAKERLRPLDRIHPPDVWHRATRLDPIGDVPDGPGPSWQRRVAAGTVAFAVFAGALALVFGAFGDRGQPSRPLIAEPGRHGAAIITLEANDDAPTARLDLGETTTDGVGSSFCWEGGGVCVDVEEPEIRVEDLVDIAAAQPFRIAGDARAVTVGLLGFPLERYEDLGAIEVVDGSGSLPRDHGRYVLAVNGSWPEGDRTFYFGIYVTDEAAPEPDPTEDPEPGEFAPIEVVTPARGDEVTAPVTITGTADVFEATVSIEIRDQTNNVIAETVTTATCGTGCRGDFAVEVPYSVGETQPGEIRVFEVSAMDGKPTNVVRIPVTLQPGDEDPVAAAVEGVWSDADGNPLPDGTDASTDFSLVMHVAEGPDHCGWTSVTFMNLGWPLGTQTEPPGDFRQYVRDPHGVLSSALRTPFGSDGDLPADIAPSGFRRGDWELWTSRSDVADAVYVVNGDPRAGGTWERWPRAIDIIGCD
jgi:hypothetical protein